jgi:hypothetical protein
MVTISRENKIAITTIIVIATVLSIALPLASAQATNNAVSSIKTLKAQGNIYQTIDSNTIKYYPASLTLTLQPTSTNGPVKKFDVAGGTLVANGVSYTFTNGNGGVLIGRHIVLLQAQGTSPDGQAVTLKLAGQYPWFGGSALGIGAKLQTEDANYTLLMRAPI